MFPANAYVIRLAGDRDSKIVAMLAQLDEQPPLTGPVLIGELHGIPAAAISLVDGRIVADPFQPTMHLTPIMRLRAEAFRTYAKTPSLRVRLLAGLRIRHVDPVPAI